jgi:hypothetical protein
MPDDCQIDRNIDRLPDCPASTLILDAPYQLRLWRWRIPVENESQHQDGQDRAAAHQKNI